MTLHPQARAFLDGLTEQNAPGWDELSPQEGREVFSNLSALFGEQLEVAAVRDRLLRDDLVVRIYSPRGDGPFPAIVYFHGGGWVLGDLDTHDALCRRLANEAEAVVVSVEYRLSPETVFPGGLHDCYDATQFVSDQAASLNVDPLRIIVAGDSAGANFAAAVALLAQDSRTLNLSMQLLIYPVLDHRCGSNSYTTFAEGFGLSKKAMQWFWTQYLGSRVDDVHGLMSPSSATELRGLPPTHIITAEYDVLRDEGEDYARRLQDACVPTTHRRYNGMIHGFIHFCGLFDMGREAISDIAKVIRNADAAAELVEYSST
jgi:acetyl esterase/lipase